MSGRRPQAPARSTVSSVDLELCTSLARPAAHPSAGPRSERCSLPACRSAHLPICPPAHLPTCQPANLPTCQPANLPTCQPTPGRPWAVRHSRSGAGRPSAGNRASRAAPGLRGGRPLRQRHAVTPTRTASWARLAPVSTDRSTLGKMDGSKNTSVRPRIQVSSIAVVRRSPREARCSSCRRRRLARHHIQYDRLIGGATLTRRHVIAQAGDTDERSGPADDNRS